ncbi:MAG TPA: metallophosphoesterase family protein [Terriglobales bacterium]|nr:metallophosphoesterase family protein [Terriglobales bacterium]
MLLGLISDTHNLLRPEAAAALQGVDQILHAGDVGDKSILESLNQIAPVTAIRGNVDKESWSKHLPETDLVEAGGITIYLIHDLSKLDLKPETAGIAAVIYGHSHQSKIEEKKGVLYINPGSAGPRRFNLPITIGKLEITKGTLKAEILNL